ncbi:hypothetical protein T484DRAFT_1986264 [Baffinella frigidus]|nr:hypothetical protein T484DRAFT_1986264 [Cryptophyta sp. CCMP2293]|mmetsp:Transcript_22490/g.53966  ORF Transcript_22490/g.53966 Transcript_22490/m.53966 type:complete len:229 (-) Transcript_22490:113-799(-)
MQHCQRRACTAPAQAVLLLPPAQREGRPASLPPLRAVACERLTMAPRLDGNVRPRGEGVHGHDASRHAAGVACHELVLRGVLPPLLVVPADRSPPHLHVVHRPGPPHRSGALAVRLACQGGVRRLDCQFRLRQLLLAPQAATRLRKPRRALAAPPTRLELCDAPRLLPVEQAVRGELHVLVVVLKIPIHCRLEEVRDRRARAEAPPSPLGPLRIHHRRRAVVVHIILL